LGAAQVLEVLLQRLPDAVLYLFFAHDRPSPGGYAGRSPEGIAGRLGAARRSARDEVGELGCFMVRRA
ncbi:MAG TPA: hypothetical protein PLG92_12640, partial [Piscinibacter sp.]|nr:hypothetical protein [Piscinibacter sp.]